VDIVVTGRNVEVPEHFRVHVSDKITSAERLDSKAIRYEVVLYHEKNPRLAKVCQRVEITGKGSGSTVRAEASGPDFHAALEGAMGKLEERLRRLHDRRKVHHGLHQPTSVAEATASLASLPGAEPHQQQTAMDPADVAEHEHDQRWESTDVDGPGRIVREKEHRAEPMTVNAALDEMELLGHDFYLFADASCGRPTVIYRRKGFDYGIIRLVEPGLDQR
jgi:ribosomal subunit interface protein